MTGRLVLLRHGESVANAAQEFTGRIDVDLTTRGVAQARDAARLLDAAGLVPDVVLTSPMVRALRTAQVVQTEVGGQVPLRERWRLVERDYGFLTGLAKAAARERLGPERFVSLRRTRHGLPGPLDDDAAARLDLYEALGSGLAPAGRGESLQDVVDRVAPCWAEARGLVADGAVVLVVAHGNSLRALCLLVDGLSDEEVLHLNLPQAQPLVYALEDGVPRPRGGRYLDPGTAHAVAAQIASEGGT
ncbi:phosphoglycerate mutase [Actinotalea ferrariae CF5-4]|uniref:2,3-bisphosphoglycerate-dependent phosphoglycerate mutase n=1 Tax=Actinotalea ferrariae CF5-4 TaxID=948458 RepID=A0A021VUA8_9CELL|nr:2,3-bisphosphoglycerate-dependent phosphoglycerate mutase [Actinotalea ferrariae]EYR62657.1 phosphoglycerate mutase [Actinotalea ferrariae CF5-4]